jgi:hypothetical protein
MSIFLVNSMHRWRAPPINCSAEHASAIVFLLGAMLGIVEQAFQPHIVLNRVEQLRQDAADLAGLVCG